MSSVNRKLVGQPLGLLGFGIVLCLGMLVVTGETNIIDNDPPVLDCGTEIKANAGKLCGSATDVSASIRVTATFEPSGVEIDTDDSATLGVNYFCFSLEDAQPGDVIRVTATDASGNTSEVDVEVVDCE